MGFMIFGNSIFNQNLFAVVGPFLNFRPFFHLFVCLIISPSFCPSICQSVRSSKCSSFIPSVFLLVRLSVCSFVFLSVRPSFCPSVFLPYRLSVVRSFVRSILPFVFKFVCFPSVCLSVPPFFRLPSEAVQSLHFAAMTSPLNSLILAVTIYGFSRTRCSGATRARKMHTLPWRLISTNPTASSP
jgi:hypothetical protein